MDLFILTSSPDLTAAAVASAAAITTEATLPDLVFGDSEALTIKFLSAASTYESWTIASSYTVTAALGSGTTDGTQDLVSTSSFTDIANGFSGRLDLSGAALASAIDAQRCARPHQPGAWFTLQITVTDPTSHPQTYALLPIFVRTSVR